MPEEQEDMSAAADSEVQVERTVQRSEVAVGSRIASSLSSPAKNCRRPILVPFVFSTQSLLPLMPLSVWSSLESRPKVINSAKERYTAERSEREERRERKTPPTTNSRINSPPGNQHHLLTKPGTEPRKRGFRQHQPMMPPPKMDSTSNSK